VKKHTKVYLEHFDYTIDDFIPCEICGGKAVDIHHIDCRGMGGSKAKDKIENLMALCRSCHIEYGDKKDQTEKLKEIHCQVLKSRTRHL
jgi:5-methylcytosine-specific restriction endonuclease McrA